MPKITLDPANLRVTSFSPDASPAVAAAGAGPRTTPVSCGCGGTLNGCTSPGYNC